MGGCFVGKGGVEFGGREEGPGGWKWGRKKRGPTQRGVGFFIMGIEKHIRLVKEKLEEDRMEREAKIQFCRQAVADGGQRIVEMEKSIEGIKLINEALDRERARLELEV